MIIQRRAKCGGGGNWTHVRNSHYQASTSLFGKFGCQQPSADCLKFI